MKQGIILAAIALGLSVSAIASQAAGRHLSAQDRQFIAAASQGNTTEVQLGQLAVSKHDGRRIQQFGQRMIQDHSAAENKLVNVAANVGVRLPMNPQRAMGPAGRASYASLSRLPGYRFSRNYMADMVRDHHKDIAAFEREIRYGRNPAVRSYARATLPTLENHLAMADQDEAMLMRPSRTQYAHRRM